MVKFMGLMNSSWVLDGHDIATAFNLSCFQNIVDLGGQIPIFFILLVKPLPDDLHVCC